MDRHAFIQAAGTISDFLITCAHETGHLLRLSTSGPAPAAGGGSFSSHDLGHFPIRRYYRDGTRVPEDKRLLNYPETQDPKMRLFFGLMSQGAPNGAEGEWKWLRHEDWKAANENAASLEPTP